MLDPDEVKEWLVKAEQDYQGALHLARLRKKPLPDLVCFHCQQAAEKYLKALLIMHEKPFPKSHDLLLLFDLVLEKHSRLVMYRGYFEILNPFSVQFRYPGEQSSAEDVTAALRAIKELRKILLALFPAEIRNEIG
jgi:HEPN domain-containing protein